MIAKILETAQRTDIPVGIGVRQVGTGGAAGGLGRRL